MLYKCSNFKNCEDYRKSTLYCSTQNSNGVFEWGCITQKQEVNGCMYRLHHPKERIKIYWYPYDFEYIMKEIIREEDGKSTM